MSHWGRALRTSVLSLREKAAQATLGGSWALTQPPVVQHNLRNFWFDGLFASASDAILLTYLTLFILALGASEAQIGLMSALASLSATLLLLPGAALVERLGTRKRIVVAAGGIIARLMILLMVLAPILFQGSFLIYFAIALEVGRQAFANLSLPAWVSLTGDLVPLAWRGRYFASRNIVMSIATILMTLIAGQMITSAGGVHGYQIALALAFAFGIISTLFFSRLHETPLQPVHAPIGAALSLDIFRPLLQNRQLLAFCLTAALWNFALNIAGPFFSVYQAKHLMLTPAVIGLMSIVSSLAGLPAQRIMGPLTDRLGPHRVQLILGFLIPLLPASWILVTNPAWAPWQIAVINTAGGFLWAGYSLASFNLLLAFAPPEQRARTSAIYQVIVSISLALGAATGGFLISRWGFPAIFLGSALLRLAGALLFARFVKVPSPET